MRDDSVNYHWNLLGIGKIDNADIAKGYEVDADTYVLLEPEEIESIKLESKREMKTIDDGGGALRIIEEEEGRSL